MKGFTWEDVDGCIRAIIEVLPGAQANIGDDVIRIIGLRMQTKAHANPAAHNRTPAHWIASVKTELAEMGLLQQRVGHDDSGTPAHL